LKEGGRLSDRKCDVFGSVVCVGKRPDVRAKGNLVQILLVRLENAFFHEQVASSATKTP
jgi:hypothetical protein